MDCGRTSLAFMYRNIKFFIRMRVVGNSFQNFYTTALMIQLDLYEKWLQTAEVTLNKRFRFVSLIFSFFLYA